MDKNGPIGTDLRLCQKSIDRRWIACQNIPHIKREHMRHDRINAAFETVVRIKEVDGSFYRKFIFLHHLFQSFDISFCIRVSFGIIVILFIIFPAGTQSFNSRLQFDLFV